MKDMNFLNPFTYSDKERWKDIEKQMIFEAWVPFVSNRPLQFFVPYPKSEEEEESPLHTGIIKGHLTNIIGDDSTSSTHNVVSTLKRRKVVVLSRDSVCKNDYMPEIIVARIFSIKDKHREARWYPDLVSGNHEWFVHLPKHITGRESYVNMTQTMPIGKNLLIKRYGLLDSELMKMVEARYKHGIALGVIKETSDGFMASSE